MSIRARQVLFSKEFSANSAVEREELAGVVRAALDTSSTPLRDSGVRLDLLSGSRSGSLVFRALPLNPSRAGGHAGAVVKIGTYAEGAREKANYDRLVAPLLPSAHRPDLLSYATAGDRAALCFSFVPGASMTDRLVSGDFASVDCALSTLFSSLHASWYGSAWIEAERDLARYYRERYFGGSFSAAEADDRLMTCAVTYFDAKRTYDGCLIRSVGFPSPERILFSGSQRRSYHSCILHGDLNSDNVVMGQAAEDVQLVDFARTGRGQVHQDCVGLEASVRINWPLVEGDVLQIERLIATGENAADGHRYAAAILDIRAAAQRLFGPWEDPANYNFAVAAVGLRLMRATDLSHAARARITAATLWAAKFLDEGSLPRMG